MSVAALQAIELRETLAGDPAGLSLRFYKRAARLIDIPWSIAAGNDLRMPEAQREETLAMAFHRVAKLLAPPTSVMHPANVLRVIRGNLGNTGKNARLERPTISEVRGRANAALP